MQCQCFEKYVYCPRATRLVFRIVLLSWKPTIGSTLLRRRATSRCRCWLTWLILTSNSVELVITWSLTASSWSGGSARTDPKSLKDSRNAVVSWDSIFEQLVQNIYIYIYAYWTTHTLAYLWWRSGKYKIATVLLITEISRARYS